jgi:hypothetical protein
MSGGEQHDEVEHDFGGPSPQRIATAIMRRNRDIFSNSGLHMSPTKPSAGLVECRVEPDQWDLRDSFSAVSGNESKMRKGHYHPLSQSLQDYEVIECREDVCGGKLNAELRDDVEGAGTQHALAPALFSTNTGSFAGVSTSIGCMDECTREPSVSSSASNFEIGFDFGVEVCSSTFACRGNAPAFDAWPNRSIIYISPFRRRLTTSISDLPFGAATAALEMIRTATAALEMTATAALEMTRTALKQVSNLPEIKRWPFCIRSSLCHMKAALPDLGASMHRAYHVVHRAATRAAMAAAQHAAKLARSPRGVYNVEIEQRWSKVFKSEFKKMVERRRGGA